MVVSNIEENKFNELKVPMVKEDRRYRNNHIVRFCSCDMSCMCVGAVGVRVCNCQCVEMPSPCPHITPNDASLIDVHVFSD